MGKIGQGILGGLSGKVGNVIGASWKGIHYIRIKPVSVANPRTVKQVNQRNRFTAALEFLQPNLAFIDVGYKYFKNHRSAYNAAMAYILRNAITGIAPDFEVDYSMALLSRGKVSPPVNAFATFMGGSVEFNWDDNSENANANADDRAMLLMYNPSKQESVTILEKDVQREDMFTEVTLPSNYLGDTVELFMAFQKADASAVSNSVYLGSHVVV